MTRPVSPTLPDEGLLVGWSLEGEPRKPLIGFTAHLQDGTGSQVLEPVLHTGEGHLITVAPTGGGKGVGCIIPALLRYKGPVVVIDPKGENYAVTARARREMGQKVVALDPFNTGIPKTQELGKFNPLDFLSEKNPTLVEDAEMIANTLLSAAGQGTHEYFWPYMGSQLLTLLLLYQIKRLPPEDWNLVKTRELLASPLESWPQFASQLTQDSDDTLRRLAGLVANPAKETFGGYWAFAQMQTAVFKGELVGEAITTSSFSLQELVDGDPLSLYIIIPPEKLEAYGNLLKVWLAVMISALTNRRSKPERSTLFILDEAAQLGHMPQLRQAITLLRSYGVRVWSFWQDLSQLQGLYPETWQTLLNNCHIHQFFAKSTRSGALQTYDVTGLGSPEYLQTLEPGEMVLSVMGDEPVIARVPNYLWDEPFKGLYDANPFYQREPDEAVRNRSQRVFRRSQANYEPVESFGTMSALGRQLARASYFHPVSAPYWQAVDDELSGTLLAELGKDYEGLEQIEDDQVSFRRWPLSFYEEYDYYEIELKRAGRRLTGYFIRKPGEAIALNGSAMPIHQLNERIGLTLRQDQAIDYLYFFCTSTEAEHGRFLIVDHLDDLTFRIEPDEEYLNAIKEAIEPPVLSANVDWYPRQEMRAYRITATVLYADMLFRTFFRVWTNGQVEMLDDEELLGQVPVMKDEQLKEYRLELQPKTG